MSNKSAVYQNGLNFLPVALAAGCLSFGTVATAQAVNSCPVDGCMVDILSAEIAGGELNVLFEANFKPSMSKNHLHVWWGENFTVEQVSGNAESFYGVTQGDWHPTDQYPEYTTTGVISMSKRGDAVSICVTASGRTHDILDPDLMTCKSIADLLN